MDRRAQTWKAQKVTYPPVVRKNFGIPDLDDTELDPLVYKVIQV